MALGCLTRACYCALVMRLPDATPWSLKLLGALTHTPDQTAWPALAANACISDCARSCCHTITALHGTPWLIRWKGFFAWCVQAQGAALYTG